MYIVIIKEWTINYKVKIPQRSEIRDKKVKAKISNLINENYKNDMQGKRVYPLENCERSKNCGIKSQLITKEHMCTFSKVFGQSAIMNFQINICSASGFSFRMI